MYILIFILLFGVYFTYEKVRYLKIKKESKKLSAKIILYKKEKGRMRNNYTKLYFPYVEITNSETIIKLHSANSATKDFKIGEIVDVFWYKNELLLWNEYERGFYKYLPSKLPFIKN